MSDLVHQPSSERELRDLLLSYDKVKICGTGTRLRKEGLPSDTIELSKLSGILDLRPADMTLSVRSGTELGLLQSELREVGLCLPTADTTGSVGGAYMCCTGSGEWRDWILGATFMLADGMVAKSGSHVVKSVAGYDIHRFIAGTRGALAMCLELVLRAYPISYLPAANDSPMRTSANHEITDLTQIKFMKRAKAIFDPTNKLNPGEWGFM
ncbi:MAG: FAD-binding oxidoreductase [Fimbriimonadaceae bacterium]|nr:FAD-binding oxidoreductase [Fimbriimonadaceae bacterium]